eukprot:CAMPEP_0201552432 /NCGR_PEP_ID=MMETSP0173_2-20130828/16353_1 /ASSEMBLY_ACC=CAM_ASM_000268 /TAXON_ID=218659 /ORGANISM="Vexillifera sp., Strain DIVA3 564/2" /LENGTH=154 /DNA_ID=CAMNT_0047962919 /DNA_START=38 /DNA_END=502 /DNA_ORIENTATION=-
MSNSDMSTPKNLDPKDIGSSLTWTVAYDHSPESRAAVEHAATLLRVQNNDQLWLVSIISSDDEKEQSEKELQGAKALALLYNPAVKDHIHERVEVSDDRKQYRPFLQVATELKSDYVVVGCRGSGVTKMFLGSFSNKVLKHCACPVIVCRSQDN